jgi:ABC-type molybdate transport system substrate-binding protein
MIIRYLWLIVSAALTLVGPANAAEIKVLSTNALKTVLEELGPKFEQGSENKLAITWGTTTQLKKQIEEGAAVDVAVVTDAVADDLIKQGKLNGLFERLGVAEQIKNKLIPVKAAGQAVAEGQAEIGFTQISEVLPYAGAEVGGMLPPDIQLFTNFVIGIRDKDSKPAEALVRFLTTPAASAAIKIKGLEPL